MTHKKIVLVQFDGIPSVHEIPVKKMPPNLVKKKGSIMVFIQTREGLQIKKDNLSYAELKLLVEKLESLC